MHLLRGSLRSQFRAKCAQSKPPLLWALSIENMESLKELEEWYFSQCNEDWEHTYGIEIGTLDNPGWFLKVHITDTNMEEMKYEGFSYGVGDDADASGNDWIITKLEDGKFVGYGGPYKLNELIKLFLKWVKNA